MRKQTFREDSIDSLEDFLVVPSHLIFTPLSCLMMMAVLSSFLIPEIRIYFLVALFVASNETGGQRFLERENDIRKESGETRAT